eukprot:1375559-Rhodomonas_salina.1
MKGRREGEGVRTKRVLVLGDPEKSSPEERCRTTSSAAMRMATISMRYSSFFEDVCPGKMRIARTNLFLQVACLCREPDSNSRPFRVQLQDPPRLHSELNSNLKRSLQARGLDLLTLKIVTSKYLILSPNFDSGCSVWT